MEEVAKANKEFDMDHWFSSDVQLHQLYPREMQILAARHWTPLRVAHQATQFLVPHEGENVKILDIGSGVGKFCLVGAYYRPQASFFGVEQRKHLVGHAKDARAMLCLKNVHFFAMNVTELDFRQFDHFYFYNSFYENLLDTCKIDDTIICSPHLYNYYNRVLYKKLEAMPAGTRVVTFHCVGVKIPPGYLLMEEHEGTLLQCWLKI